MIKIRKPPMGGFSTSHSARGDHVSGAMADPVVVTKFEAMLPRSVLTGRRERHASSASCRTAARLAHGSGRRCHQRVNDERSGTKWASTGTAATAPLPPPATCDVLTCFERLRFRSKARQSIRFQSSDWGHEQSGSGTPVTGTFLANNAPSKACAPLFSAVVT
jgi:hypothetical protein